MRRHYNNYNKDITKVRARIYIRKQHFLNLLIGIGSVIDIAGSRSEFSRFRNINTGIGQYWGEVGNYFITAMKKFKRD
jgi:hypothetical protein